MLGITETQQKWLWAFLTGVLLLTALGALRLVRSQADSTGSEAGTVGPGVHAVGPGPATVPIPQGPPMAPGIGFLAETQPGKITITVPAQIEPGAIITATVANGLAQTIYTDDEKSDCSIVTLERRTRSGWTSVTGCLLGRTPFVYAIGPGRGRSVAINPRSAHFDPAQTRTLKIGTGTYRLRFSYRFMPTEGSEATVHSTVFQIGP